MTRRMMGVSPTQSPRRDKGWRSKRGHFERARLAWYIYIYRHFPFLYILLRITAKDNRMVMLVLLLCGSDFDTTNQGGGDRIGASFGRWIGVWRRSKDREEPSIKGVDSDRNMNVTSQSLTSNLLTMCSRCVHTFVITQTYSIQKKSVTCTKTNPHLLLHSSITTKETVITPSCSSSCHSCKTQSPWL